MQQLRNILNRISTIHGVSNVVCQELYDIPCIHSCWLFFWQLFQHNLYFFCRYSLKGSRHNDCSYFDFNSATIVVYERPQCNSYMRYDHTIYIFLFYYRLGLVIHHAATYAKARRGVRRFASHAQAHPGCGTPPAPVGRPARRFASRRRPPARIPLREVSCRTGQCSTP